VLSRIINKKYYGEPHELLHEEVTHLQLCSLRICIFLKTKFIEKENQKAGFYPDDLGYGCKER